MKFTSVNELHNFSFRDCVIARFEIREDLVSMELEALIVEPSNSQNTHFTQSYAGTAYLRLTEAAVLSGVKVGYRTYDADGKLLSEIPDVTMDEKEIAALPGRSTGAFLPGIALKESKDPDRKLGVITVEFPPEEQFDTLPTDSYELTVSFENAVIEWDFFMNKVETPGM